MDLLHAKILLMGSNLLKSIESVASLESEWQVWVHNIASDTQGLSVLGAFTSPKVEKTGKNSPH